MPAETPEDIQTIANFRERLLALLRFSQELTMTGDLPLFFRNPKRVEGGVREALWDSEQSVPANAMAVLVDVTALQTDLWAPLPKPAAVPEAATTPSESEQAAKDGETVPETPDTPSRHE